VPTESNNSSAVDDGGNVDSHLLLFSAARRSYNAIRVQVERPAERLLDPGSGAPVAGVSGVGPGSSVERREGSTTGRGEGSTTGRGVSARAARAPRASRGARTPDPNALDLRVGGVQRQHLPGQPAP